MTIEELSARLEKVESQNRRMRAGGIAALVFLAAGVAMGQAAPAEKVVRAERIEVHDTNGNTRAVLKATADGYCGLSITDMDGTPRVSFGMGSAGSSILQLQGKDGKSGTMLSEHGDGSSGLSMKDKDGESRVLLYTNAYGPSLVLGDKDGKTRASLRVTADGSPTLKILDKEGITRAGVGVTVLETTKTGATTQTAESSVVLFDKEGTVIFKAPTR